MPLNFTSGNDAKTRIGRESAPKVLTPKNLKTLSAIRSVDFSPTPQYQQSDALDPSGNITDVVLSGFAAQGSISTPLCFPAASTGISDLIESSLRGRYDTTAISVTGCTIGAASRRITTTGNAFVNIAPGDAVKITASSVSTQLGVYFVSNKVDDNNIDVYVPSAFASATGVTVVRLNRLKNATTYDSYNVEVEFPNTPAFILTEGACISSFALNMASRSMPTFDFQFQAMGMQPLQGVRFSNAGGTTNDPAVRFIRPVRGVPVIRIGDALGDGVTCEDFAVKSLNATMAANGMQPADELNNQSAIDISFGYLGVTGSFSAYLKTITHANRVIADTDCSIQVVFETADAKNVALFIPRAKLSGFKIPVAGVNSQQMQDLQFSAFLNDTFGATVGLHRL